MSTHLPSHGIPPGRPHSALILVLVFRLLVLPPPTQAAAPHPLRIRLTDQQAQEIGRRLWHNECAGTIDGLTSWNAGEDFASLGIGHFIWYPVGKTGPFAESFPALLGYLQRQGIKLPRWLASSRGCPWPNRTAFQKDFRRQKMRELRTLLAETIPWQARFAARRVENVLPKLLSAATVADREHVQANFARLAAHPLGLYALMDYINFKGEGISPSERYRGQGWGLLQVLQEMGNGSATAEFARAASAVLTRRVANSPPERGEARWLPGWRRRCLTYAQ